jgi:hypothetical protein
MRHAQEAERGTELPRNAVAVLLLYSRGSWARGIPVDAGGLVGPLMYYGIERGNWDALRANSLWTLIRH